MFQKKAEYCAKRTLELIHTNKCGPVTLMSFSEKMYFITFIDYYTRKTKVYFLKEKLEACEVFKKFKVMVEKTTNLYIKAKLEAFEVFKKLKVMVRKDNRSLHQGLMIR